MPEPRAGLEQLRAGLRAPLALGAAVAVLAIESPNPTGYGRVLTEGDRVLAIREEKDASEDERRVRVRLTPAGWALRETCTCLGEAVLARSGMSLAELAALHGQLHRLRAALQAGLDQDAGDLEPAP